MGYNVFKSKQKIFIPDSERSCQVCGIKFGENPKKFNKKYLTYCTKCRKKLNTEKRKLLKKRNLWNL